ncbi:MAG: hypothetical protein Q9211_002925 [Gyalolechia sp. 1 TL-2023]
MLDPLNTRPTPKQIKVRYRDIAAYYHPDRPYVSHLTTVDATRILIVLQFAKETLMVPRQRRNWERDYFQDWIGGMMRGADYRQKTWMARWHASRSFTYYGGDMMLTGLGPRLRGSNLTACEQGGQLWEWVKDD